jgi:hypothetical protein
MVGLFRGDVVPDITKKLPSEPGSLLDMKKDAMKL